jgi:hypothetical protein
MILKRYFLASRSITLEIVFYKAWEWSLRMNLIVLFSSNISSEKQQQMIIFCHPLTLSVKPLRKNYTNYQLIM